jgi:hexosaminidase
MWNNIIPRPRTVQVRSGSYRVRLPLAVGDPAPGDGWLERTSDAMARILGHSEPLVPTSAEGRIDLALEQSREIRGTYRLKVAPNGIRVLYRDAEGLAQAMGMLCQGLLLSEEGVLPAVVVEDHPVAPWRGFMLDTARHFFPIDSLDRIADLMWLLRLNRFHLHLTDDQGWRFPVPGYPRLTEIGSVRSAGTHDGQQIGGFYDGNALRRFDARCRHLGITVVPETDLPGHASAALSAYPTLSCSGTPTAVETRWGIFPAVLCAGADRVRAFLTAVYATLADYFHGPFIHIGGDEVPPEPWQACHQCRALVDPYQVIVRAMADAVVQLGRRPVAWDEAANLDLPEDTIIVNWREPSGAVHALERGYDVVFAPVSRGTYLDYKHRDCALEPGRLGVATVTEGAGFAPGAYGAEIAPVSAEGSGSVIGGQANLWTEGVRYHREVEYMTIVRLAALAQGFWSNVPAQESPRFWSNLESLRRRLYVRGFNTYPGRFS